MKLKRDNLIRAAGLQQQIGNGFLQISSGEIQAAVMKWLSTSCPK